MPKCAKSIGKKVTIYKKWADNPDTAVLWSQRAVRTESEGVTKHSVCTAMSSIYFLKTGDQLAGTLERLEWKRLEWRSYPFHFQIWQNLKVLTWPSAQ